MANIHIGTDPEVTIRSRKTGEPVPAHVFFPDKHHKMLSHTDKQWKNYTKTNAVPTGLSMFKLFRDGYNVEVNTMPSHCRALLFTDLRAAFKKIREVIGKEHEIVSTPAYMIDLQTMKGAPPDVREFGCDPSLDAYADGMPKIPQLDAMKHPIRYAGGHMHFSINATKAADGRLPAAVSEIADPRNYPRLIKLMDLFIGIPLAVIFGEPENFKRREVYGQAGEYRAQDYGIAERQVVDYATYNPRKGYQHKIVKEHWVGLEYRAPGPQLFNHMALASLFFGVGRHVLEDAWKLRDVIKDKKMEKALQTAVNTGKDAVKFLQTVPGFYDADTIKLLAEKKKHFGFDVFGFDEWTRDFHEGWTEWAAFNRVPVPNGTGNLYDEGL